METVQQVSASSASVPGLADASMDVQFSNGQLEQDVLLAAQSFSKKAKLSSGEILIRDPRLKG